MYDFQGGNIQTMNKKVLIISSSPRKGGNTDILCDAFAEGSVKGTKFIAEARALGRSVR